MSRAALRHPLRLQLCVLLALLSAAPGALAFTIEVGEIIGIHAVEVTATALDRSAVLKLVNRDSAAADCELHIDTGPEDRVRRVSIPALGSKLITQPIRPSTQRVRVSGVCS